MSLGLLLLPAVASHASAPESPSKDHIDQQMPVRGIIRSRLQTKISSEFTAKIEQIAFKEGEQFFKGDLLVRLDCQRLMAEWDAAAAYKREMELALKSANYLLEQRVGNKHRVETAMTRVDRAKADLMSIRTRVNQCEVRAPYDGLVSDVSASEHELSAPGKPLMSIVSFNDPRLELIVPSSWLTWLKRDMTFEFRVDETQTSHKAQITRIGAIVDSVSQTIKVYASFASSPMDLLPGMSGTARFD